MSYVYHHDPDVVARAKEFLRIYEEMEKILVEYCLQHNVNLQIREERNAGLSLSLGKEYGDVDSWGCEYPRGTWITSTQTCS
jgi:hypothetical protein